MNIATRIRLLGPALVLAAAVLVGATVFWGYRELLAEQQFVTLGARCEEEARRLELAFDQIHDDVRFLSALAEMRALVEVVSNDPGSGPARDAADRVADEFVALLRTRPAYSQARVVGVARDGREVLRVEAGLPAPRRVQEDQLQQKGQRDYFEVVSELPTGRVYTSEVTLNREFGRIEEPHEPMVRVAAPLDTLAGERFGFVIVNIRFEPFVGGLFEDLPDGFVRFVTNDRGDYLVHPDRSRVFGWELAERHTLQGDYEGIGDGRGGIDVGRAAAVPAGIVAGGGLLRAARAQVFPGAPGRHLVLALVAPFDRIDSVTARIAATVAAVALVLLAVAVVAAYAVSARVIRPLRQLTEAADRVVEDPHAEFAPAVRDDEVGRLAAALDHMLRGLREQEHSLREANRDLEYFARIASHDLREPAQRLAMLASVVCDQERGRLSESGGDALERLRREGLRMIDQLTDLRAFSRIGRSALARETVAIDEMARGLLDEYDEALRRRAVSVVVERLPPVEAYGRLVELLYRNLIGNALQHAAEDGFELRLTWERRDGDDFYGVRNTGARVEGDPERLFEPFHRESRDVVRSGLGLSICRRIVERHAGRIWIEAEADAVHVRFVLRGGRLGDAGEY